jgi:nucleoside-diphosphate-sugar epimerase
MWSDRHTPINKDHRRGVPEEELLALSPDTPTTVLNLAGLWGGTRKVKNWVGRVAPTRDALKGKVSTHVSDCICVSQIGGHSQGSLHMIHGEDVARAVLAVHKDFDKATGQRWLLTDGRVQDWWDLASAWGTQVPTIGADTSTAGNESQETKQGRGPQPGWVQELMREEGIRALPRPLEKLGRALDSQEFWNTFGIQPVMGRIE